MLPSPREVRTMLPSPREVRTMLPSPREVRTMLPSPREVRTMLPSPREVRTMPQEGTYNDFRSLLLFISMPPERDAKRLVEFRLTEEEERDIVLVITTVSHHKSLKQQEIWTLNAPFCFNVYKGNTHAAHDPFLESIQTSRPRSPT
ncbi:P-selectin glycoprotein ligand 1 [Dissostichus eleginoides]|uniref:P-selectin glycoprotein ligand 1 n=1 Tax=Dissostichus eleginoides TaxID=100907 RepID=A0AAD9B2M4_DISEL|nr:P-selectin glycoprotein ligand 1 [Dissostichus eleginoides]